MAKLVFRGVGGFPIDIIGGQELINAFKKLGETAVMGLEEPCVVAANVILQKAKELVPIKTGKLEQSLKVYKPTKSSRGAYRIIAKVGFGRGAAHGIPLELGHRMVTHTGSVVGYVQPRPFLRPAADSSKAEVSAILSEAMSNIVKEAGK